MKGETNNNEDSVDKYQYLDREDLWEAVLSTLQIRTT